MVNFITQIPRIANSTTLQIYFYFYVPISDRPLQDIKDKGIRGICNYG